MKQVNEYLRVVMWTRTIPVQHYNISFTCLTRLYRGCFANRILFNHYLCRRFTYLLVKKHMYGADSVYALLRYR